MFAHFIMGDLQAHLSTLQSVQQFLTKNSITPVPHHPYLPDLALRDFVPLDEKSP